VDVAGIITATGGVIALLVKVAMSAPRKRKAADVQSRLESLETRQENAEAKLLGWAGWAHDARVTAAANGVRLPKIPAQLLGTDDAPAIPAPRAETAEPVHA
jgi:hypothetical protein